MNQTSKGKKKDRKKSAATDAKYSYIFILSFVLPFIAWGCGALLNPTGWASEAPQIVLMFPFLLFSFYPAIFLIVAGLLLLPIVIYKKNALQVLAISFLVVGIIYSTFIFMITEAASESEFTG